MTTDEADLGSRDDAGAAADGGRLTPTITDRPERSTAGHRMHGPIAGPTADGDLPEAAADVAVIDGTGTPQLPGLETY